ncbi:MAG: Cobalt-zinc-cadmium resistance protein CzcB [Phycisphaerae bacterium]|nr:Cobalt-zinc-cadmium resistance protein CzcB [Phycisphaerae bacterium]
MTINRKRIGLGIAAVVILAGAVGFGAWFLVDRGHHAANSQHGTCTDHGCGEKDADHGKEAGRAEDDGHDHGEHDGHGHGAKAGANLDPKEIEKARCEHDIRTIDCDECRYELGVVKVAPSVTDALTKTAAVREGESGGTLRLTGEVQYDQTTLVEVLPAAGGRVVSVKARLGQQVGQGDVLAIIHSSDFGEAKAAYLEAFAAAEVAAQERQRQLAISASLEKLLAASRDEHSDGLPGEVLGEWKSKLVNAVARLKQAKIVLEREKSLVAKQASSKAELETAEREMQTAQADYTALLEEIQLNIRLDRLKAESAARLADARLNAAEQRLHLFGLDDEAIKAIPQMKDNGTFAQLAVKAPRAGVITARNVTEGRFVENSQTLYTIADTSNVWVWCDLYERDLGPLHERLAKGHKPQASVKVTAFADVFPGAVDLLDSAVNETTRTLKVRVQVKNEGGRLRPGMFAAVDIPLTDGGKVAMVPRQAVLSDEGQTFAFVHWKDDLWLRRDVELGRPRGEMVEILQGLSVGDRVVAGGGFMFKSDILRAKMGAGCAD